MRSMPGGWARSGDHAAGRLAMPGGKAAGKMGGAFETELVGDGFDLGSGLSEEQKGLGHLEAQQAVVRGFVGVAFEEAGQVTGGNTAGGRGLLHAGEAGVVAEEMVAAALEGGERGVMRASLMAGFQEVAKHQGVLSGDDGRGQMLGRVAERMVNDLLEKSSDAGGIADLPEVARRAAEAGHQAAQAGAVEVEEKLHQR